MNKGRVVEKLVHVADGADSIGEYVMNIKDVVEEHHLKRQLVSVQGVLTEIAAETREVIGLIEHG